MEKDIERNLFVFVKWHIKIHRLFSLESILVGEQSWCYLNYSQGEDKEAHIFPNNTSPKVNVLVQLTTKLQPIILTTSAFGLPR